MTDMKMQAAVEMSVEQPVKAMDQIAAAAEKMAGKVDKAAEKAGGSVDGIGAGANGSADQLTRAEGRMVASIKRVQTQMELAGKTASQKFEFNIDAKGLDAAKFEPLLSRMRETEIAQAKLAAGSVGLSAKMEDLTKYALSAGAAFATWASLKNITSSMIEAQQSAQKLRNSLEYAAGGATGAASEIAYLRDVTNRLGMDFETSAQAYAKFAAATKDSGVSLSQTKTVFEGIAAASAKLGLSADETQGALLALSQMASKGTVSAEELRGQLGERLPGAFNIAAKSMGVTTAELGKMLETGQIMASDFLPKFGQALKDNFQAPLESLSQEMNRFSSAWTLWKQELSEGANGSGFKWLTNGLNESTAAMRALGKEAGITRRILMAVGGFQAGAVGANKFDTAKLQDQAMKKLPEIRGQREALENKSYLNQFDKQTLSELKRQEAAIRQSINDLAEQRGKETGINLPDLAGEYAAQQKKQTDKLNAYLKDVSNAPKAAKVAAEVEKENAAFKIAVAGMSETDAQYISALKAHNDRVAEIQSKSKSAQASHTKQVDALYGGAFLRQEESARIAKEVTGELKEIEKANADYAKSIEALYAPIEREAEALESQLQNYGLTRSEIEANTLARLEEEKAMAVLNARSPETIANLEREISARKRINEASAGIETRKASDEWAKESDKAAKKVQEDWTRSSEKIGDSITDALMRGFESGKGFAQTLKDTVVNMFKTMLLQPTIKATVMGGLSAMGMGSASAADSSGLGGLSNLYQTGSSLYSAATGQNPIISGVIDYLGFGAGTGAAGITAGAGTAAYVGITDAVATGVVAGMEGAAGAGLTLSAGTGVGAATAAGAGMGAIGATGAGVAVAEGGGVVAAGSAGLAAVPVVGWIALAAIAAYAIFGGKGGGPKTEGNAYGTIGEDGKTSILHSADFAAPYGDGNWGRPGADAANVEKLLAPVGQGIAEYVKNLGGSATGLGIALGYNTDPQGKAPDNVMAGVYDSAGKSIYSAVYNVEKGKASEAMTLELQKVSLAAVKAADGIKPLFKEIAAGIDLTTATAEEMTQAMSDITSAVALRAAFKDINLNADALTVSLIKSAGGIDAMNTNLNSYYQAYFSEDERNQKLGDKLKTVFSGLSLDVPDSLASFRKVVEGLDLTTASGTATFTALMNVQASFASVTNAATAAAKASADAAKAASDEALAKAKAAAEAVASERTGLQDQLDELTMTSVQLLAKQRTALDESNRALFDQINALEAQKAAIEAAIEAATSTAESGYSATSALANAAADAAETAVTSALSGVQTAIDAEKTRINASFAADSAALNTRIGALKALDSQLKSAISSDYTPSLAGYKMAQNGLDLAASNMQSGILPDSSALSQLIDRSKASTDWFSTAEDMMRSQSRTDAALSSLSDSTTSQGSVAQQTLDALTATKDAQIKALDDKMSAAKAQVDALHGIDNTALSIDGAMSALNKTTAALKDAWIKQDQAAIARKQLDALQGIDSAITDLSASFQELNASIYALAVASGKAAAVPVSDYAGTNGASYTATKDTWSSSAGSATTTDLKTALTDIYKTQGATGVYNAATSVGLSLTDIDRITGMTAGTSVANTQANILADLQASNAKYGSQGVYDRAKALGLTLSQVDSIVGFPAGTATQWAKDHGLAAFASGGDHAGGFRMVGEDGPEIEYTPPSHIYSNQQSKNLIDITPLLAEIKSLREEIRAGQAASIGSTNKTASLLDRVIHGEDAVKTKAA